MTDNETLFLYRMNQAEETLSDAGKMLLAGLSTRSVINRAYYSMFYALLALFLKTNVNIKSSKYIGVISVFNKEFIKTGKIDKYYSKIIHEIFDARQESDYKEYVEISEIETMNYVKLANEFIKNIKDFIKKN